MRAVLMIRLQVMRRIALAAFVGGVGFLAARPALAEDADIDHLTQNLASGSDFRIRTQAALALGASKSRRAVQPLCSGLDDSNATVRAASAAALGRLHMGGAECLQKRLANEASDTVKSAIQKALDPVFTSETKYYLAIGKVTDKTGRGGDEIDGIIHNAMALAASALPVYAVAPPGELVADAKRRLSPHSGVKSYFLSPRITAPDYTGGNLTVKLEIAMFSYPEKSLIGNYTTKLTEPGVSSPDRDSENDLIKTAGERALDKFSQIAAHLQ